MDTSGYAAFIEQCRAERATLVGFIDSLEKGELGIGMPIILPQINEATANMIASCKRTVSELDTVISAYEANPDA